jgi:hypothetical protein
VTPAQLRDLLQCAWETLPCLDPLRPVQWERGGDGVQYGPYALLYDVYRGKVRIVHMPLPEVGIT